MKKQLFLLAAIIGLASGCTSDKVAEQEVPSKTVNSFDKREMQSYSNGRRLYKMICQSCHMENGEGFKKLIPPLAKADYLEIYREDLPRTIKYGLSGPITVNGVLYNQPMPANPKLTDVEVAQILTYIGNTWGNAMGSFTTEEVINSITEKQ
ncbi:c-type cytochrome [Roseivirga echinicomitans]